MRLLPRATRCRAPIRTHLRPVRDHFSCCCLRRAGGLQLGTDYARGGRKRALPRRRSCSVVSTNTPTTPSGEGVSWTTACAGTEATPAHPWAAAAGPNGQCRSLSPSSPRSCDAPGMQSAADVCAANASAVCMSMTGAHVEATTVSAWAKVEATMASMPAIRRVRRLMYLSSESAQLVPSTREHVPDGDLGNQQVRFWTWRCARHDSALFRGSRTGRIAHFRVI